MNQPTKLLTGAAEILAAAQQICREESARLAIAFWGDGAVQELGLGGIGKFARIVLNATSGACNPNELETLMALAHVKVRHDPRLHAKVAISAQSVLVGSANASSNGLGFQAAELSGWREACTLTTENAVLAQAADWFEKIWKTSEPLKPEHIAIARAMRTRLREHAQTVLTKNLDGQMTMASLEGLPIFVAITDEESTLDEASVRKQLSARGITSDEIDFYEDWSEMPRDATLLAFEADANTPNCNVEGVWSTTFPIRMLKDRNGRSAYPVTRDRLALEKYGLPALRHWLPMLNEIVRQAKPRSQFKRALMNLLGMKGRRPTDMCVPAYEILKFAHECRLPLPKGLSLPTGRVQ